MRGELVPRRVPVPLSLPKIEVLSESAGWKPVGTAPMQSGVTPSATISSEEVPEKKVS